VLKGILRTESDEMTGDRRKMLTEYHHNLSLPPNVSRMINPRRMRLVGQVTHTGDKICV
jgi:hypothetical protein